MNEIIIMRRDVVRRFFALLQAQMGKALVPNCEAEEKEKALDYVEATLHALLDFYECLDSEKSYLSQETKERFKGFRYANNKLKHQSSQGRQVCITETFKFPIMFPMYFGKHYVWGDLSTCYSENRRSDKDYYPFYQKYIEGIEVRCALKKCIDTYEKELGIADA